MKGVGFAVGALLVFVAIAPARAEVAKSEPVVEQEQRPIRLTVVLVDRLDSPELGGLIREWLEPLGLEIQLLSRPSLEPDHVLAPDEDPRRFRLWVTLTDARHVRIYFADHKAERFLVRDVALEHALEQALGEVDRELLAQVLLSAALAFVERREGSARAEMASLLRPAEPAPKPPEPSAREAPPERVRAPARSYWSTAARYGLQMEGASLFSHGPSAALEAGLRLLDVRVGALAELGYVFPHVAESDDLRLTFSEYWLRLHTTLALVQPGGAALFELGPAFEQVRVRASPRADTDVRPRPSRSDLRLWLGGAVSYAWRAGPARLGLGLRMDVALSAQRYDVLRDGELEREIAPWRIRPGAFFTAIWP